MNGLTLTALCLSALLAATACGGRDPRCANLPGGGRYCLQTTAEIAPFDVQQQVDVTFNGRRETMIFELEVDAGGMRLAGLTPFGQKLIQASYDNREARADTLPDDRLDPSLLLALLQITLWPADSVRAGLASRSMVLEEREGMRRVLQDGNVLLAVGYTGSLPPFGDMRIEFPAAHMKFDVKTLDALESNGTK
jgi:hypothetical protein